MGSKKKSSGNDSSNDNPFVRNLLLVFALFLVIGFLLPTSSMQMYDGSSTSGTDTITLVNSGNLGSLVDSIKLKSSHGGHDVVVGNFDGVDDYVDCGDVADFDLAEVDHAISFWFNAESGQNGYARLVSRYLGGSPGAGFYLGINSGSIIVDARSTGDAVWLQSASGVDDGDYHHVVYTVDVSEKLAYLYFDGSLVDSVAYTGDLIDYDNESLYIGNDRLSRYEFNGVISNVQLYHDLLDSSDVLDLYDHNVISATLKGYWLDGSDFVGTTVHDVSGLNHDGTLFGDTGTNFWFTDSSSPFRVDITNFGITLSGSRYAYSGTLDRFDTLVLDRGTATIDGSDVSGSMTGSLGIISPGDSVDIVVDQGLEYEVVYNPYSMEIEVDSDLASGDSVVINTKLVTASGQDVADQPNTMRIRLTDARNLILDKEVNSVDYVIPAEYLKDGGHRQARLSYYDDRFGGWSNEVVIDWDVGVDGYIMSTDAGSAPSEFSESLSYRINGLLTRILSNWAGAGIPLISDIADYLVVVLG